MDGGESGFDATDQLNEKRAHEGKACSFGSPPVSIQGLCLRLFQKGIE